MAENENDKDLNSESVIERAKKRFQIAEDYWNEIYKAAEDDLKFRAGQQWPEELKRKRDKRNQPSLVINKTNQAVRQVTNDQRQNRPSIKVSPIDDLADVETAKIRQGITRHIEYRSGADAAYDTGFEQAATGGIGFWRLTTDYCNPLSFDQEIFIKRVPDFRSIYLDPSFQEPDGSDSAFGFSHTKLPKAKFKAEYPNASLAKDDEWDLLSSREDGWVSKEEALIVEYYEKIFEEKEINLLSNGDTLLSEELEEVISKLGQLPPNVDVVQVRKAIVPSIKWYKIAGDDVLEETDIPGEYIPLIPILGSEYYIDGKRMLEGIVRSAKDPARMYNYMASAEAETIALAPKAPWIVAEGQIKGYENEWASANIVSHSYLQYKQVDINGTPAPRPTRNVYEAPTQAITQARMLSSDDVKAATGIYDAALGAKSNETSGIAIQRRNMQAQTANFHLIDNLTRSIRHTGRIINQWIPTYYDGPRVARIVGEEGQEEVIKINQEFQHKGELKTYRMDVGEYDVAVETGPSYATKRQEAVQSMLDLTRSYPNMFPIIGDLMLKNMDIPGAQEMAERLKKVAPAGVIEDKDKKPLPPEVAQQMQQQGQLIDGLTKTVNDLQDQLDQKTRELESKERIALAQINSQIEIELAKLGSKESQTLLIQEIGAIKHRLDLLHSNQPIDSENESSQTGASEPERAMASQPIPTGGTSPGNNMGV